jgi:hypothetical protein
MRIRHEFVSLAPDVLEQGVLYVSIEYATVLHLCACGCGAQVVTPLAPGRWRLTFDGKTVSLNPSIGNWSLPCRAHYWIDRNHVVWDRPFSQQEIAYVRAEDRREMMPLDPRRNGAVDKTARSAGTSWLARVKRMFRR